jgi:hypothetical protein
MLVAAAAAVLSHHHHRQADWAYAVRQVEESAAFSCRLPQLELRGLAGAPVVARDVLMWRVDSLEGDAIGMAVLIGGGGGGVAV